MPQATAQQFEDLGAIKENVRFNEKAIDEIKQDIRGIREDINALDDKISMLAKDMDAKISTLSEQYQSLGWKGMMGIVTIVLANVILKFIPG